MLRFWGVVAFAIVGLAAPPPPSLLHQELLARYKALRSFYAEVVESLTILNRTSVSTKKIWFQTPRVRIEREMPEDAFLPNEEPLAVYDLAEGRRWGLAGPARWVEEDFPPVEGPWALWALGLERLGDLRPAGVREEAVADEVLWILEGALAGWGNAALWLDPATLFIRRARYQNARVVRELRVTAFDPEAEIAAELFRPPSPEEIARVFRASPEGMALLSRIVERHARSASFFLRKRTLGATTEEWVYWWPPYLRVEVRTRPLPWLGSELLFAELFDLQGGRLYFYDPDEEQWFEEDFLGEAFAGAPAELALAVAFGSLPFALIVGAEEVILDGRPAWRLTGKPLVLTDPEAPLPQWWVDKETLLVVQYTEPMRVPKDRRFPPREWAWEVRTVRILEFKEDVEFPPELFALPEKAGPPPITLPVEVEELLGMPKEKLEPTSPALPWEPFSPAKLEEALSTSPVVVLYFSADWCLPCHILEDEAFRAPAVIELLAPYPRLKVDLDQDPGARQVANVYRVRAVPTLLFLDAQGKEIGRITGYSGVALLRAEILKILREVKQ